MPRVRTEGALSLCSKVKEQLVDIDTGPASWKQPLEMLYGSQKNGIVRRKIAWNHCLAIKNVQSL